MYFLVQGLQRKRKKDTVRTCISFRRSSKEALKSAPCRSCLSSTSLMQRCNLVSARVTYISTTSRKRINSGTTTNKHLLHKFLKYALHFWPLQHLIGQKAVSQLEVLQKE